MCRRLIGTKGCNMKKIIQSCDHGSQQQEAVKLRLRGKGSGFKEGPNQEESEDELHMCVSSSIYEKYVIACDAVEELIKKVYDEYKQFTGKKHGAKNAKVLKVSRQEVPSGSQKAMGTSAMPFVPTGVKGQFTNQAQFTPI